MYDKPLVSNYPATPSAAVEDSCTLVSPFGRNLGYSLVLFSGSPQARALGVMLLICHDATLAVANLEGQIISFNNRKTS